MPIFHRYPHLPTPLFGPELRSGSPVHSAQHQGRGERAQAEQRTEPGGGGERVGAGDGGREGVVHHCRGGGGLRVKAN